jgi:hypothetical protein
MKGNKKCSVKKHQEIDAIKYCQKCDIYMCNQCIKKHSELLEGHRLFDIVSESCQKDNHLLQLKYFCENHNKLCCDSCINKVKGYHKDCVISEIEEIKEVKINNFYKNMQKLYYLSNNYEKSLNELQSNFYKFNNKDDLIENIKNIFTEIKKELIRREKEILIEVDSLFEDLLLKEIQKYEKIPKIIKGLLNKSKTNLDLLNDERYLAKSINNCIDIEQNIKLIENKLKKMNDNITRNNNYNIYNFHPEIKALGKLLVKIKRFGYIYSNIIKFKECPYDIDIKKKYEIKNDNGNIVKKIGEDGWVGINCEKILQQEAKEEYIWIIKILKSFNKSIMVGVSPFNFNSFKSSYKNCGWYFFCYNSTLCSGPPHNYDNKKTNLKKVKNEIKVVMNMKKRSLKFIIDNENNEDEDFYTDIPLNYYLIPNVFLYHVGDSVEIYEY